MVDIDRSVIGKPTGAWDIVVERSPIEKFASAVQDKNPVYHSDAAAAAAGFSAIPAPPTWTFTAPGNQYDDLRPQDPSGGQNPMFAIMGQLHAQGALVLHGEQEFEYHAPITVGDEIVATPVLTDVYEKDTDKATMVFTVIETEWTNKATGQKVLTERFNLIGRLAKK
ncbi:MAG: FAS1-like dehydratase domain-containing protein [Acidimicrobiia bacterium]